MRCQICFKKGRTIRMQCGHAYHAECLRKNASDWQLPCFKCQCPLAKAVEDGGQWYIGIDTTRQFDCMYKISHENLIVRTEKCIPRWHRDNGRLLRRVFLPIKNNICVS